MRHVAKRPATVNADFVTAIIMRAAGIVNSAAVTPGENPNVFEALQQARDEYHSGQPHKNDNGRTYGWPQLVNDLRQYLEICGAVPPAHGEP